MMAVTAASATHRVDPGDNPMSPRPLRPAKRMAAVAESAATTRWRDEPNNAKASTGSSNVYSPVTTGIPAMVA